MPKWKALSLVAAGFVLCAAIAAVTSGTLVAEMKTMLVKDLDNPARQPVFLNGVIHANAREYFNGWAIDYVVPDGKRLVVEFINAGANQESPTEEMNYQVKVRMPDGEEHDAIYFDMESFPHGVFSRAQAVRLYYGPGTHFAVSVGRTPVREATLGGHGFLAASGYLVDVN